MANYRGCVNAAMKFKRNKFYFINVLFFFISGHVLADGLSLPKETSCSLNVSPDQQELMLKQCKIAANSGDSDAQYLLGVYYSDGKLRQPDFPKAIYWFKEASSRASVDAQVRLADMYKLGLGVPADRLQAYVIYKIASINGSDYAMDQADLVAESLTPQELQQANYILGKAFKGYLKEVNQ